ncbi:MAG TPA: translation initiation factor IF-2 N-terminal domain-containing protein, partial [Amycolatopsis sp.]|nr:translation initiation factor IF-2 N-terminal domain-containing protein [Amycolatopsis sp.]
MSNEETPAGATGGTIDASTNPLGELPPRVRVHALAKLLGSNSRDVLAKLTELGETARSAQSSVPREVAIKVAEALAPAAEGSAPAAPPEPADQPAVVGTAESTTQAASSPAAEAPE